MSQGLLVVGATALSLAYLFFTRWLKRPVSPIVPLVFGLAGIVITHERHFALRVLVGVALGILVVIPFWKSQPKPSDVAA